MADDSLARLISDVRTGAKYQHVTPTLIERIGAEELVKRKRYREALKATRAKLHQVAAAYQHGTPPYADWLAELRAAADRDERQTLCERMLAAHASTRERLPQLRNFYRTLFAALPRIDSVLDVACGLNPLAIPWMRLSGHARYTACDVFEDLTAFLDQALPLLGLLGSAHACDVLDEVPDQPVDLALVLKTIPCLEQVDRDAGARLLSGLNARHIAVSYPVTSLGGRDKGMQAHYRASFAALAAQLSMSFRQLPVEGELLFLISR